MSDFDELLTPRPLPAEPGELQALIARDASRVQRRRRWFVRGRRVAVVAAIYVAGLATMWSLSRSHEPAPAQHEFAERPAVRETQPPDPPAPANVNRYDPPERLEKWAFISSGEKRSDLYRQAGDGFLLRDDVNAALRCYRRALDGGTSADLAIHAERDTWLFMSLKVARQKEKSDARVN